MIYKIYEGLSDYLMAPDGTVIHKETTAIVPFEKSPLGSMVKLITDETHTMLKGKRKAIRLVRRYTKEQIMKMYANSKVEFKDDIPEVTEKIKAEKVKGYVEAGLVETGWVDSNDMTAHQKDIAVASMDHGEIRPLSIPSGYFLEEAGQISQEQMDQLAASKRTVKKNKKEKKSESKEIAKVIKGDGNSKVMYVQADGTAFNFPYLSIEGVNYQSANKASKALGISINTVLKRAKANKDGWFYITNE